MYSISRKYSVHEQGYSVTRESYYFELTSNRDHGISTDMNTSIPVSKEDYEIYKVSDTIELTISLKIDEEAESRSKFVESLAIRQPSE